MLYVYIHALISSFKASQGRPVIHFILRDSLSFFFWWIKCICIFLLFHGSIHSFFSVLFVRYSGIIRQKLSERIRKSVRERARINGNRRFYESRPLVVLWERTRRNINLHLLPTTYFNCLYYCYILPLSVKRSND